MHLRITARARLGAPASPASLAGGSQASAGRNEVPFEVASSLPRCCFICPCNFSPHDSRTETILKCHNGCFFLPFSVESPRGAVACAKGVACLGTAATHSHVPTCWLGPCQVFRPIERHMPIWDRGSLKGTGSACAIVLGVP
jgi:hypothetical protein